MANVENLFNSAVDLEKRGSYNDARNVYEQILLIDPNHVETLYEYATLLNSVYAYEPNITERVFQCTKLCVDLNPNHSRGLGLLAVLLENRGDIDAARHMYECANSINPKSITRLLNYARFLEDCLEYDCAKQIYHEAMILEPENVDVLFNYGDLLQTLELPDRAEEIYERVLRIDPNHDNAKNNLGMIMFWKAKTQRNLLLVENALNMLQSIRNPHPNTSINVNLLRDLRAELNLSSVSLEQSECQQCRKPTKFTCSICKSAKYCGQNCQRAHWKTHKKICKPPGVEIPPIRPHFGYWGCGDCGGECDCFQETRHSLTHSLTHAGRHTQSCHHYMNTLRRKGPDCPGLGACIWLVCCESKIRASNCTAKGNERLLRQFKYVPLRK